MSREAALNAGRATQDLLSNPYPNNTDEARHFVDGWAERFVNNGGKRKV